MSTKVGSEIRAESARAPQGAAFSLWTIGAIAVVAYSLANILHEGLGHGGACILMGGRPIALNAIFFNYDHRTVSANANRFIASAGGMVNLTTGLLALASLRWARPLSSSRYFLWLFSAVSLLMAFGYLGFSGMLGIGDWIGATQGLGPPAVVRLALIALGTFLYFVVAPKLLIPEIKRFLDLQAPLEPQIKRLMRFPYLVGGCTFLVAGLFNPGGIKLLLISAAAASFGGTSLLAWHPVFAKALPSSQSTEIPTLSRPSKGWLMAATFTLLVFVGVLGPGLNF